MDRRSFLTACGVGGAAGLAGCSGVLTPPADGSLPPSRDGPVQANLPEVDAPISPFVSGNTSFGIALHQRLAESNAEENLFLSPYSIGVALAMTYAGANGETRTQIGDTLRFQPRGTDLHQSIAALRSSLPFGNPKTTPTPTTTPAESTVGDGPKHPFTLSGANAVWLQTDFPVSESYTDRLKQYYAITTGRVDFESDPAQARQQINAWVADRTQDEIPELFPPNSLSPYTRLVLANAVYFEANWADTFDEAATEPATFTALDGTDSTVPMMHERLTVPYASVDGHEIVQLPYAGPDVDMVVMLPERGAFRSFERTLSTQRFHELLAATEPRKGDLALPRFQYRSSLSLPETLQAMGMERPFTTAANFDGITPQANLKLGDVQHEATITVDEQGTEAAAATGVEVVLVSAPANPWEMVVDRPFLFAIRHQPTDAVLFLGRVVDAAAAQD